MALSPEEFAKRLDAISEYDGIPYGRAHLLFDEEQKHQEAALRLTGYLALSDAFKCFFLETVELVNTVCRSKVTTPLSERARVDALGQAPAGVVPLLARL